MPLEPGTTLAHYRLVEKIGEGGMGVVWRAADTTLGREVAIKVLPQDVATDSERLARFEREARLLATLNHPNIAQVFGFHEQEGVRFLAMELVPGESLEARLLRGPLDVDETIEVGLQVAAALESAHLRGVIHRDLKPANIVTTPDGRVKVLDFGLARMADGGDDAPALASLSPTLTTPATLAGALLGTAAYMSPEQARGRAVDKRTDLWAFGCVLFACLTGTTAFRGDTVSDTLASVLVGDPDWSLLPRATPRRLRELLRRCLAKDADLRQRDAGDAGLELQTARLADADAEPAAETSPRRGGFAAALRFAAVTAGIVLAVALPLALLRGDAAPAPRVVRASLDLPPGWSPLQARISPDGSVVGVVLEGTEGPARARALRAFLRTLASDAEFRPVPGELRAPVMRFSPDSRQVVLLQRGAAGVSGSAIVRLPADGSSPPALVTTWQDAWLEDMVWLSDREIAVVSRDPPQLVRIPLDGRPPAPPLDLRLSPPSERFLLHDVFPDGTILGTVESWVGGYHQDAAWLDPATGAVVELLDRAFEPTFVEAGWLLFTRRDQLLRARFDLRTKKVSTAAEVVAAGLRATITATAALFSISERGDLVHLPGGLIGANRRLVWLGPNGEQRPWGDDVGAYIEGSLDDSQDGRVIAFMRLSATGLFEVWASETDDPAPRRVLALPGMDCEDPVVSGDGRRIAASCLGDRQRNGIYIAEFPSAANEGTLVLHSDGGSDLVPRSWTPDGRGLFVRRSGGNTDRIELLVFDQAGRPTGEPRLVPGLSGDIGHAMIAPNGRLIGFSEADGDAYSLQVAPWDGERAGPPRPVMRTHFSGFDWTGVQREGGYELATVGAWRDAQYAIVDDDGRTLAIEPVSRIAASGAALRGVTYLSDGRILALEADPAEIESGGVQLATEWLSTLPR